VGLGRFIHEAAVVDPLTGFVYLTEDEDDGRFYRFRPAVFGNLSIGVLEAAAVASSGRVSWVAVPNDRPYRGRDTTSFNRGEGSIFDAARGAVFFTTTSDNRVWSFHTGTNVLRLVYDAALIGIDAPLRDPDNVTIHAPTGHLYVAEDADDLQLVLLAEGPSGWQAAPFLQLVGHDASEIAGPAFSPDGTRLYFSSQRGTNGKTGMTFEVAGPFQNG
jgi:secreted PhoX family phosphatase